jgi:hypothetical protein
MCLAAALWLTASGPAATPLPDVYPVFLPRSGTVPGFSGFEADVPALLLLPSVWNMGDAAVILVGDRRDLVLASERLTASLLAEGAAILQLETSAVGANADLLPTLFGALAMLRRHQGSGPVVVVGWNSAADAALAAVREEVAAAHVGAAWPRFAAGAALGPVEPAFAAGTAPPPREGWPARAEILCRLLSEHAAEHAPGMLEPCLSALAR